MIEGRGTEVDEAFTDIGSNIDEVDYSALDKSENILEAADAEPVLWRSAFPREAYTLAFSAERHCLDIAETLKNAFCAATGNGIGGGDVLFNQGFDRQISMPQNVVAELDKFANFFVGAVSDAIASWNEEEGVNQRTKEEEGGSTSPNKSCDPFVAAATTAAPLLALQPYTKTSLLEQRDQVLLVTFSSRSAAEVTKANGFTAWPTSFAQFPSVATKQRLSPRHVSEILSQDAALGWMATVFLCSELSLSMGQVGDAWRDICAQKSFWTR